jgi:hypothetical protein
MAASGTTKKVTSNQILGAGGTATLASATITGAATVGTTLGVTGVSTLASAVVTGDLTVDTSTLKVDSTNDRVGIGITSPLAKLDIRQPTAVEALKVYLNDNGSTNIVNFKSFDNVGGEVTRFAIAANGVATWSYVGGVAGTAMTLNSTSNLVLRGGTAAADGVGLTFPATQVASSDANCLDDYEEGTWTIGLTFGGGNTGLTTALNTGRYTKIGRQVTVCGRLELSNKGSSTGAAVITGLPFAVGYGNDSQQAASFRFNGVSYVGAFQGYGPVTTTTINLEQISTAGAPSDITDSNFSNATSIQISLTYTV